MTGRFTNLRYDTQAYNDELSRSTGELLYRLDPNFANNCNPCFAPHGPRGGNVNSIDVGQKIDVDSILRGVSKINTKSNNQQIPDSLGQYHVPELRECSGALEANHSRYTHPARDIRGLNVDDMRFDYPLHDPQCNIFENFAVNTRLQAKDDHKTIWQTPIDQNAALPTERLGRVKNCTVTMNCNYAPYSM